MSKNLKLTIIFVCRGPKMGSGGEMDGCGQFMKYGLFAANLIIFVSLILKNWNSRSWKCIYYKLVTYDIGSLGYIPRVDINLIYFEELRL